LALCSGAWHLAEEEFTAGEFVQARQNFERVLELSRDPSQKQGETSHQYWFSTFLLSATLFTMGYAQQARQKAAAAVREAQAIGQPIWIAVSALGDANVHQLSGAPHRSLELTEQVLSIANDHGMSPISRLASYFRAMSLVRVGRVEEGTAQIRMIAQAEDPLLRVGATIGLASACCSGNHPEEGLRLLPRTLELIERTGERKDEALLHRIWGELLLMRGDRHAGEAERRLRTAIEVAKWQSAKFYELLAAISLARLLGRQDRREEARAILADIYGWFTEGFDTAMLQEAKALLIELKHNA
jgi:tetratricopeptide (TPR) repeat protein